MVKQKGFELIDLSSVCPKTPQFNAGKAMQELLSMNIIHTM